jgi:hypothetical protein
MASKIISFQVDGLPESLNTTQRKYKNPFARNKYYKQWYDIIYLASIRQKPVTPWEKVHLTINVYRAKRFWRDYDGLVASLKPVVDGIVRAGHIKDDNYDVTGPWHIRQFDDKKCTQGRMVIVIEKDD